MLRPCLVLRLPVGEEGGRRKGADADWHCHSRLRSDPDGKEADIEPGDALFRAAGAAPGGPAGDAGGKAAGTTGLAVTPADS